MSKAEFPPLLPPGFHSMSLGDLSLLTVNQFPLSLTRPQIMDRLTEVVDRIIATGLEAEIWVDGSFLTDKIEPEDSDIVVRITGDAASKLTIAQEEVLEWLNEDLKPDFLCDSYTCIEYEPTHKLAGIGQWMRAYWIKQYGFSRSSDMKGIAVVTTP